MIGNGFEFYFHWRKTFDVMIKKEKVIFLRFYHIFVPISTVVKVKFFPVHQVTHPHLQVPFARTVSFYNSFCCQVPPNFGMNCHLRFYLPPLPPLTLSRT